MIAAGFAEPPRSDDIVVLSETTQPAHRLSVDLDRAGVPVHWRQVLGRAGARRVELPTYAFQEDHYWL
ncbi:MAG TPA: hypothetical protein VM677_21840 [Actinokineospora sp.]|nr:hypothetical protein [Actinokineospora sp.]